MSSHHESIYQWCLNLTVAQGLDGPSITECISDRMQQDREYDRSNLDQWLLVLSGAMVFVMQVGFAMLCAGCVRKKNVQNTMLKNLLDACGAGIAFYAIGFAFAFGGQHTTVGNTFVGTSDFFLSSGTTSVAFWFFEWAFSATAVTIVAGALAERCQMMAYLCYSVFLTGFIYPVVVHAIWSNNGFLSPFSVAPIVGNGAIDFAGSGVVHVTGGSTCLIATKLLGARRGRFTDSRGRPLDKPNPMPGHSVALQLMGTMMLWFGWYGFNPGSAVLLPNAVSTGQVAALAATNTSLSAAAGAISALFANLYVVERRTGEYNFDLTCAMNGCLIGLVSVTAACAVIEMWAAILIGLVGGCLYLVASAALIHFRLDDAVDATPVHLVGGAWGVLATGLFASPSRIQEAYGSHFTHMGLFYSFRYGFDFTLMGCQILELLFIAGWAAATMTPFFMWLNYMGWFRSDSLEELVGLDISYHGGQHQQEEMVREEFVKAYKDQKTLRQRNAYLGRSDTVEDVDTMSWTDFSTTGGAASTPSSQASASRNKKLSKAPSTIRVKSDDDWELSEL